MVDFYHGQWYKNPRFDLKQLGNLEMPG